MSPIYELNQDFSPKKPEIKILVKSIHMWSLSSSHTYTIENLFSLTLSKRISLVLLINPIKWYKIYKQLFYVTASKLRNWSVTGSNITTQINLTHRT